MLPMFRFVSVLMILMAQTMMTNAQTIDHSTWDGLLKKYVHVLREGQATQVDYAGFLTQRSELSQYLIELSNLSSAEFDALSNEQQLAFLINAYNAWTVEFILTQYPDLDSIKDLGSFFRSPWKKEFIPLLGKTRSLDDIEHNLIRGSERYKDARIHFAVNCASVGCPALRAEAYQGATLNAQLEEQTQLFLADSSRNRLAKDVLEVSSIFKWYREDFEKGWSGADSLEGFFALYAEALKLTDQQVLAIQNGKIDIEFLDYDWHLNKKP